MSEQVIRVTPQESLIFKATITATVLRKKTDTTRFLAIQERQEKERDTRSKAKKLEKAIAIIEPAPKQPTPPTPPTPPILPAKPEKPRKQAKPEAASNLLNRTNYYVQLQEKLQSRETRSNLHQKTQSLEISNMRKEVFFPKGNTMDVLRKLISSDPPPPPPDPPRPRHREKLYVIRENRIVQATTREEEMKKHLEEEISNRTEALRNCQRKMREMSMEEPILPEEAPPSPHPKPYSFPHLRLTHFPF